MSVSVQKLRMVLAEHDSFNSDMPGDTPVYLEHDNCLYELAIGPTDDHCSERLTLADLRAIVAEHA